MQAHSVYVPRLSTVFPVPLSHLFQAVSQLYLPSTFALPRASSPDPSRSSLTRKHALLHLRIPEPQNKCAG